MGQNFVRLTVSLKMGKIIKVCKLGNIWTVSQFDKAFEKFNYFPTLRNFVLLEWSLKHKYLWDIHITNEPLYMDTWILGWVCHNYETKSSAWIKKSYFQNYLHLLPIYI
jgi:hypothetical protein